MQVMTYRSLKNDSASAPSARIVASPFMHLSAEVVRGHREPRSAPTSLAF